MQPRKRKSQVAEEVNWDSYFKHIKCVCPWSLHAWHNNKIDFCRWLRIVKPLDSYQARIYWCPNHSKRQLKELTGNLNNKYTQYEWLWSEPSYGNYATPVNCIIQQDYKQLNKIRQKINK